MSIIKNVSIQKTEIFDKMRHKAGGAFKNIVL